MGRSVSTPNDARHVLYLDWYPSEEDVDTMLAEGEHEFDCRHDRQHYIDEVLTQDEWDYVIEDFRDNVLHDLFPSVEHADGWAGNEDRIVAANRLAEFGVSEYSGLAALWVRPVRDQGGNWWSGPNTLGLAEHWIDQAWPKIEARFPHRLVKMGSFSNGEGVYQRAERDET